MAGLVTCLVYPYTSLIPAPTRGTSIERFDGLDENHFAFKFPHPTHKPHVPDSVKCLFEVDKFMIALYDVVDVFILKSDPVCFESGLQFQ